MTATIATTTAIADTLSQKPKPTPESNRTAAPLATVASSSARRAGEV
jgi:hypothetical protein